MAAFRYDAPNYLEADWYRVIVDDERVDGRFCLLDALALYKKYRDEGMFAEVVAMYEDGDLRAWGIPWGWLDQWAGVA